MGIIRTLVSVRRTISAVRQQVGDHVCSEIRTSGYYLPNTPIMSPELHILL